MKKKIILKSIIIFVVFIMCFSLFDLTYAATHGGSSGSTHGGSSGSFDSPSDRKTGKNVSDADELGENALGTGALNEINKNFSNGAGSVRYSKFNSAKSNIWGVLLTVLQVASIAGVIFAGVRYMFASSDSKADMKKSMIYLIIGMVIVFSASTVVGITTRTFNDIVSPLNR